MALVSAVKGSTARSSAGPTRKAISSATNSASAIQTWSRPRAMMRKTAAIAKPSAKRDTALQAPLMPAE